MTTPSDTPVAEVLRVDGLLKAYGRLVATDNVSTVVRARERRALIGPNGAGKSTLFKLVCGQVRADQGSIHLNGVDVTGMPVHQRAQAGLAATFQHSNLMRGLDVRENVALAVSRRRGCSGSVLRVSRRGREFQRDVDQVLDRFHLGDVSARRAESLSHGQQRQVEIAVSYATQPQVLLLDEPAAGLAPAEVDGLLTLLAEMDDITCVMIEHNIDAVMQFADSITVLDAGRVIAEGPPAEIVASEAVQRSYLGFDLDGSTS